MQAQLLSHLPRRPRQRIYQRRVTVPRAMLQEKNPHHANPQAPQRSIGRQAHSISQDAQVRDTPKRAPLLSRERMLDFRWSRLVLQIPTRPVSRMPKGVVQMVPAANAQGEPVRRG
jgi:hypothetical protein